MATDRFISLYSSLKCCNKVHLFYTVAIFLGNFSFGNISGVTMVDLSKVYGIDLAVYSQITLSNSIFAMVGSLVGMLYRWINRQLCISFFFLVTAACTIATPFLSSPLWLAYFGQAASGFGQMVWFSGVNIWLVEMWPQKSATMLQAGQFMYGLGSVVTPLVASKFVYGEANRTADNQPLTLELRRRYLAVPYAITGGMQVVAPLLILIFFFVYRYKAATPNEDAKMKNKDENHNDVEVFSKSPDTTKVNKISFRKLKLSLCGLCLAMYATAEIGYFPYCSPMWQYMEVHLSATEAASVTSVFSMAYTLAPIITAFVSLKIQPDLILTYHYGLILTGVGVLYLGRLNKVMIYTGNVILGYGFSPMIPALIAFTQRHLKVNDRVSSFFYFCTNIVGMIMPLVLGRHIQAFPLLLLYLLTIVTVGSLLWFVSIRLWLLLSK